MPRRFGPPEGGLYVLLVCLAFPAAAQAQWNDGARVSINAGIQQPASTTFTGTTTKAVNLETASIDTSYSVPRSQFFDGGVLVRVKGGFGVGAALSMFMKSSPASVGGTIPHPFVFTAPRMLSGMTSSLERRETGVHVQAAYVVSSKRVDVAIAGGPTIFSVSQELVADATYTDTYPYDTVTFTGATVSKVSATKLGFNISGDVSVKLSKHVGVGGLIRFSRATIDFPLAGTASGVSADVGGAQAGGGIRFYF
jgi:hypothetical protein